MGVIFDVTKKEKFVYSGRNSEGKFAIATQLDFYNNICHRYYCRNGKRNTSYELLIAKIIYIVGLQSQIFYIKF